jgi:lipopolysaccharide/colanic/teichoic acid biosynthesis glycosyltransferase
VLEHKPLSAIRFARGLSSAAREISSEAGLRTPSSYAALSRVLELNISLAFLVFIAPAFAAIAFAIKLDAGGPVFVRMRRFGRNGVPRRRRACDDLLKRARSPAD